MSKRPTKRELREQLQRHTQRYLQHGGEIHSYQRGETGLENGQYNDRSLGFEQPPSSRTPVEDVLRTIDQRRQQQRKSQHKEKPRRKKPKQKIIYDDFGEPLRVIWEDD